MQTVNFAVIFPGQGSQREGMGKDFFEQYETAKAVFTSAEDAIGENLQQICFEEDCRLNLTEYTQPAILTAEMAMYQVCRETGSLQPEYFAGHSLGEYTALTAAGVFKLTDAVQIVRKRGALMQKAVPEGVGAMSALVCADIEQTDVRQIIKEAGAEIANINSKDQIVISGKKDAVEKAGEEIAKNIPAINVIPLTVSAPFHSSLMKDIEAEFKDHLQGYPIVHEKAKYVLSNFSGEFHEPDLLIEHLVSQISGTVNWIKNMEVLAATGARIMEIGPNRVLGKFFGTIGVEIPSIINVRSMTKAFNGAIS